MNAPFVFCQCPVDYSGNVCFWIRSRFESVIRSFLPFNTVEYKSWRAVTMGNWKSAEMSFCALYGKRRTGVWPAELSYMTTCCHYRLWRPFSGDKKSSHFSASFLTAIQTRNSVFRARLRLRIFYFKPLACTFRHCFTDYPTISINTTSVTTVSYGFTLNLHANVADLPEDARVVGVWTAANLSLYPPPTAWPAAWSPSPRVRRR